MSYSFVSSAFWFRLTELRDAVVELREDAQSEQRERRDQEQQFAVRFDFTLKTNNNNTTVNIFQTTCGTFH